MKRLIEIVVGGLFAAYLIFAAITVLWDCPKAWYYSEDLEKGRLYAETEMIQTALNSMMAYENITTVTRNDVLA